MKHFLIGLMLFGLLLAGCATPGATVVAEVTPTPVVPTPTHIPVDIPPAQRAAIAVLAAQLGIPADQITVVSSEAVVWRDGCLGVVHLGVMCIQGQVAGFRIILAANGRQYEFHTNQDGSVVADATGKMTQEPEGTPGAEPSATPAVEPTHVPVDIPPVQRAAIDAAIAALGLPADQVKLVSIEPVEWPDGCLGVVRIGVFCTKGPVPGFRIILEANGKQYEFHTNLDASVVTPDTGPALEAPDAIVAATKAALASALGVAEGDIQLASAQPVEWPDSCLGIALPGIVCSQIVTAGYIVVLEANGQQYEYHTNEDASAVKPASLALSWQRTGGIAGFNDVLTVYRSGEIRADWAHAQDKDSKLSALSAGQQAQLQVWLVKYGTVNIDQHDPATAADAMSVTLTLIGSGDGQPSQADQQTMLDWAQGVLSALQK